MYNFRATSASDFFSKYDNTINRFVASGNNIYEDDTSGKLLLTYTGTYEITGYGGSNSVSLNLTPEDTFNNVQCYQTSKATIIMVYASSPTVSIIAFVENDDGSIYQVFCRGSQTSPVIYSDNSTSTITYRVSGTESPNVTALCNFAAYGGVGENTILDHLWFMPIHQYTTLGILTLNDNDYFTTGYWLTDMI